MIRPPRGACRFISRNASCVQRNAPVRFVSTTDCHCSTVSSSSGIAGAPMPALLKSRSSRPKRSAISAKSDRDGGRIGDVAGDRDRAVAGRRGGRLERLEASPGKDDRPAVAGESDGDRRADAAAGAGDERDPRHGRAARCPLCATRSKPPIIRPSCTRPTHCRQASATKLRKPRLGGVPGLSPVSGDGSSSSCPSLDPISLSLLASWTRELRAS